MVILVDLGDEANDIGVSNSGWRETVAVLRSLNQLDEGRLQLLETAWLGQSLSEVESHAIGNALVDGPLSEINWSGNIYPPTDHWKNKRNRNVDFAEETYWPGWLRAFAEFSLTCKGFVCY